MVTLLLGAEGAIWYLQCALFCCPLILLVSFLVFDWPDWTFGVFLGSFVTWLIAVNRFEGTDFLSLSRLRAHLVHLRMSFAIPRWGTAKQAFHAEVERRTRRQRRRQWYELGLIEGRINLRSWTASLLTIQEHRCAGCGAKITEEETEVDHIRPLSRGGTNRPDNLQALCAYCNRSKGTKTMAEWQARQ